MNKVTVSKPQNAESQDKGTGLGLPTAWPAPGRGEGVSLSPVPALRPPRQHPQTGPGGDILESHILVGVFWVDVFWDVASGHLLAS